MEYRTNSSISKADDWEKFEQKLPKGVSETLNMLHDAGRRLLADTSETQVQIIFPRTFPEGWVQLRKDKKVCKKLGLIPLPQNFEYANPQVITSVRAKGHCNGKKKSKEENDYDKKVIASRERFKEKIEKFNMYPVDNSYTPSPLNPSSNIDLEIGKLIAHMNCLIRDRTKEEQLYEAVFGIGNIINNLESILVSNDILNNKIPLPDVIVSDFASKYNDLLGFADSQGFSFQNAATRYPRLFYQTKYDVFVPGMSNKPYTSQEELMKFVITNHSKPYVCVYNTLMGSGKTTLVSTLAELIPLMDGEKTLIYACPEVLNSVKEVVGSNLHALNIKFAIAYTDGNPDEFGFTNVVLKEQNTCKNSPDKPQVILASINATIELLSREHKHKKDYKGNTYKYVLEPKNYVLFYDENTIGLDNQFSSMIQSLSSVYGCLPPQTIFSSATHPDIEQLDNLRKFVEFKRLNAFYSSEFHPSIKDLDEIRDFDKMKDFLNEIKEYDELKEFGDSDKMKALFSSEVQSDIEQLEKLKAFAYRLIPESIFKTINYSKVLIGTQLNKMDGEMFVPHAYCKTSEELARFIGTIDNNMILKKYYTLHLVSAMGEKLRELGIQMEHKHDFVEWMNDLSHRNQESIQNLGMIYLNIVLNISSSNPNIIENFNTIHVINRPISYDNLIKTSEILEGQTFISCANPYEEMMSKFSSHFDMAMQAMGIRSFDDLYEIYKNNKQRCAKQSESSQRALGSSKGDERVSKLDLERERANNSNSVQVPRIPERFLLGKNGNKNSQTGVDCIEWDDVNVGAHPILKFAALFGIFTYSETSNKSYRDFVIERMRNDRCVYVFVDSSFNFGHSFPFNNGIILKNMRAHSAKTLCQLMARAGRPGISDSAIIYADDEIYQVLMNSIYNPDWIDYELINLDKSTEFAYSHYKNLKIRCALWKKKQQSEEEREEEEEEHKRMEKLLFTKKTSLEQKKGLEQRRYDFEQSFDVSENSSVRTIHDEILIERWDLEEEEVKEEVRERVRTQQNQPQRNQTQRIQTQRIQQTNSNGVSANAPSDGMWRRGVALQNRL